jgi:glycosyltransferase involved in cell wall biosynthesis
MRESLLGLGHTVTIVSGTGVFSSDSRVATEPIKRARGLKDRLVSLARPNRMTQAGLPSYIAEMLQYVHKQRALDVVEMEESFGWSKLVQDRIGIPVITRLHGPHFLTSVGHLGGAEASASERRERAEDEGIARATALSSPTGALLDAIVDRYGSCTPLKAIVPNPVAPAPRKLLWSEEKCDPFAFLLVGRFDRLKGADIAIAALELVLRHEPRASLTIVGPDLGVQDDLGRTLNFDAYCNAHVPAPVRERISFLGTVPHDQVAELRRKAFATLLCSRFENFPYSGLEAMAIGCPLIASNSFNAELTVDRCTGLLVEVGSPRDLADKMLYMLRNRKAAAEMGRAGWERCTNLYAPEVVATQMLRFYHQVVQDAA